MFKTLFIIFTILMSLSLHAKVIIKPHDAMQATFGSTVLVSKKNTLLTKAKAQEVSQRAKMKLDTKIYRIFTAKRADKIVGHGILITRKVRSKSASILYMIDAEAKIKSVEVIAFNEPHEYIPNSNYMALFNSKSSADTLRVGKDIPTISGATLSARNLSDGARLALAIYDVLIRK